VIRLVAQRIAYADSSAALGARGRYDGSRRLADGRTAQARELWACCSLADSPFKRTPASRGWCTLKLVITTQMGAIVNPRAGVRIRDFLSPRPERRPEADEVAP
jgi:hypothetical protein